MTQLLHIDSSVLGPNSVSRQVSAAIVGRFRQIIPGLEVIYRDVAAKPLSHLSRTHVAVAYGAPVEDPAVEADVAAGQAVLEEFLAADIVVIGAPMYNFSIPSQLKAWIDRIAIKGKTFSYGPNGPQGLAGGKRIIVAISRGGHYGADTPMAAFEHLETYLRSVFSFIGVTDLEFVAADGVEIGPEHREQALAKAIQTAGGLAA
ncbi:FMN-dependent NADH-azoreductase [Bradyrhizobium sp. 83012]|uniref:FMN dependent NADH:quinone oxidoreductase n=1 Tax=Bradyrhizobium aeschynomenes TaxID=2734909 RepID=A0ABX2CLC6_9BRAD|nr:FMN-dependent NADH-azoreductase [Bradyrhizobium aeschynomenes]NPU13710.1 FMN-dependent NADH-azoreductase [Bradyrhizobium aeschynomenes]NPU68933.1 FMN-dependent NADH-azoreductase [Bradyrhizobium aeschynomenes]NPV22619.1 FMN-dependent NADH-azoreductase [Bradyrhizobium aeschynomenes]